MVKYCNKFFKTKEEALAFKKSHGGVMYSGLKGSRTKSSYRTELCILNPSNYDEYAEQYPFVVAWNEVVKEGETVSSATTQGQNVFTSISVQSVINSKL